MGISNEKELRKELRSATKKYWADGSKADDYIKTLLPRELNYLRNSKDNRLKVMPADILVQLVGFSWEPLFISVCSYEPSSLVPVFNEKYHKSGDGNEREIVYREHINKLVPNILSSAPKFPLPAGESCVENTPENVFHFLTKNVLKYINDGKRVVIDITGAKKSMVSGAYLFAAFTNNPVSYVDFDKYDEEKGKAYGYTCKISELVNPLEKFKLLEWQRVSKLYGDYKFKTTRELIEDIEKYAFFEEDEKAKIQNLKNCLLVYEKWDVGDFSSAGDLYEKLNEKVKKKLPCPAAINYLKDIWPPMDSRNIINDINKLEVEESIYLDEDKILVYAEDEIHRIERLITFNEDYRSALLRSAGLSEFLFRSLAVKIIKDDACSSEITGNGKEQFSKDEILTMLISYLKTTSLIKSLIKGKISISEKQKKKNDQSRSIKIKFQTFNELFKQIKSMSSCGLALPFDIFTLRNKAIHFCISVSKIRAILAKDMAKAILDEFKTKCTFNVSKEGEIYVDRVSWDALCDICGIKFLPKM